MPLGNACLSAAAAAKSLQSCHKAAYTLHLNGNELLLENFLNFSMPKTD